jgi:hypothetical protein
MKEEYSSENLIFTYKFVQYKNSKDQNPDTQQWTPQIFHGVSITKIKFLVLYKEIISIYSDNHMQSINAFSNKIKRF